MTPLNRTQARAIYKYPMNSWDCVISMPIGAEIVSCGYQGSDIVVWALVDTDLGAVHDFRRLRSFNTGEAIDPAHDLLGFVGTVTSDNGIVWHVYEVSRS